MDKPFAHWGRSAGLDVMERWPKNSAGEPETPVFLCHCSNLNMEDELKVNMLETYGIPCLRQYPGDGSFGRVVLGISGQGTEIYVPESLYNDAKELIKGEVFNEEL